MAQFVDPALQAIAKVRDNESPEDWVLCGFGDVKKCDECVVIGSGTGGIEALAKCVPEGDVAYGIVRCKFCFESVGSVKAETVKFVYVYWRPEGISIARKMKIGTLEGKIKKVLSPYHADVEASEAGELTEGAVQGLLGDVSGTTDKTGNKKATFAATGQMTAGALLGAKAPQVRATGTGADAGQGRARGAEVAVDDEKALAKELAAAKNGSVGAWALWRYRDVKTLTFGASGGGGGLRAALEACPGDSVAYAVFTTEESHDVSDAQKGKISQKKYCMFVWQPETLPPTQKARISTHKGAVTTMLRAHFPYQYDWFLTSRDELSDADVARHIGKLTGTVSSVADAVASKDLRLPPGDRRAVYAKTDAKTVGGVQRAAVLDADAGAIAAALDAVRLDADASCDFAVAAFQDSTRLDLVAKGTGGLTGLRAALPEGQFAYGLVRLTDSFDRSTVTKFLFVMVHPEQVRPQLKGKLSCLTGLVKQAFSPFHCSCFVDGPAELTDALALETIRGDRSKN